MGPAIFCWTCCVARYIRGQLLSCDARYLRGRLVIGWLSGWPASSCHFRWRRCFFSLLTCLSWRTPWPANSLAFSESFLMGPKATRCPSYTPHNLYLCWFKHNQSEPPDVVAASTRKLRRHHIDVSSTTRRITYLEGGRYRLVRSASPDVIAT